MTYLRNLFALISLPFLLVAMTACGSSATSQSATSSDWPEENRQVMFDECMRTSGGLEAYCKCTQEQIEATFTFEEMTDLERRMAEDLSAMGELQDAVDSCRHLAS